MLLSPCALLPVTPLIEYLSRWIDLHRRRFYLRRRFVNSSDLMTELECSLNGRGSFWAGLHRAERESINCAGRGAVRRFERNGATLDVTLDIYEHLCS